MTLAHVDRGALRIAYERSGGSGDPVAFVHGGWEDHRPWNRVAERLADALDLLAYDRRGHGETVGPSRARPVRDDASDLAVLLEATGMFPAHLVGYSVGGAVALRLAADRPELVRSVVAYEVPFLGLLGEARSAAGPDPPLEERVDRLRELAGGGQAEAAARGYLELFAGPQERWGSLGRTERDSATENARAWGAEMGDPEAITPDVGELAGVSVPVLALSGGESPEFAHRIQERLVGELPNARAVALPDGGHSLHRTHPDLLAGVLGAYLLERDVPST